MGAAWRSDPGGRSWVPVSRESSFQVSLGRGMLEDLLICQFFSSVKFSCVVMSECSSTRFKKFPGTVPFIMWYIVENVSSKTTCYWGGTCPVLVFNNIANEPVWNGECPRYTQVLFLFTHLGSPASSPYRGAARIKTGKPQVWYSIGKIWNSMPANLCSGVFLYSPISRMFYLWHAVLNDKVHLMLLTASFHSMVAWRRRVYQPRVNSLILRSKITFWWWEPNLK